MFDRLQAQTWLLNAVEARRHAHEAMKTRLPGWRIYFHAEMQRAIRNWRRYAEAVRDTQ
jgi:hypothetical protein